MQKRLTVVPLLGCLDAAGMPAQRRHSKGWNREFTVCFSLGCRTPQNTRPDGEQWALRQMLCFLVLLSGYPGTTSVLSGEEIRNRGPWSMSILGASACQPGKGNLRLGWTGCGPVGNDCWVTEGWEKRKSFFSSLSHSSFRQSLMKQLSEMIFACWYCFIGGRMWIHTLYWDEMGIYISLGGITWQYPRGIGFKYWLDLRLSRSLLSMEKNSRFYVTGLSAFGPFGCVSWLPFPEKVQRQVGSSFTPGFLRTLRFLGFELPQPYNSYACLESWSPMSCSSPCLMTFIYNYKVSKNPAFSAWPILSYSVDLPWGNQCLSLGSSTWELDHLSMQPFVDQASVMWIHGGHHVEGIVHRPGKKKGHLVQTEFSGC